MFSFSLNSLLVFSQVAKSQSFSKAATILSMAQPGVSSHIRELELQVGSSLIKRGKGKFELTKEGKAIFRYAIKIDKISKELENTIKTIKSVVLPLLRIGTSATYARTIMPSIIGKFQKAFPQVMIKLDTGGSEEMQRTLLSMQNDIIIVANPRPNKSVTSYPFCKEELVLIAPKGHELTTRGNVSLSVVKDYPLILRGEGSGTKNVVLSALAPINVTPSVLIEAKSVDFIIGWVSQGKGISIVTKRALLEEDKRVLEIIPLSDPLFLEISMLFLKSSKYNVWIHRFLNHMKNFKT